MPAHINGIYGFKPTGYRVSQHGVVFPTELGTSFTKAYCITTTGPLAHSVRDCISFFKTQVNCNPHLVDPTIPPLRFNQQMFDETLANKSKIKIGICMECDRYPVSKATKRAIQMARDVLTKQGYECVDVNITEEEISEPKAIFSQLICTGAG